MTVNRKEVIVGYRNLDVKCWIVGEPVSRKAPLALARAESGEYVRLLSFLMRGRNVLIGLKDVTWVWDLSGVGTVKQFMHGADAVSPDERLVISLGQYLGLGGQGYTPLTLWDITSGSVVGDLSTARGMLAVSAAFAGDGSAVLASTVGGEILVWRR